MIPIIVFLIFWLDQITKLLASQNLLLNQSVPVINNIFHFTLIHNRGAAFGIFKNQTIFFIFMALITVVIIYRKLKTCKEKTLDISTVSLMLILGGALGNLIDRIFLGYVVDFIDLRIWPVFNIADSAITIGAILLGYRLLKKG